METLKLLLLLFLLSFASFSYAIKVPIIKVVGKNATKPLPVVIWHGMGDSCCNPYSIGSIKNLIQDELGVFVYSIATGSSESKDVASSYFGDVNDQVARACASLRDIPELQGGYNAIGFSQGGQFLRAVVQRCQHTGPMMRTLITFGAQHQGVMNIPGCGFNASRGTCAAFQRALSVGAYLPWIRSHVVQAQYFKDPFRLGAYRRYNAFLADINNDRDEPSDRNPLYGRNLATLDRLVLFKFSQDDMVVPPESAWFSFFNGTQLVPLHAQPLFAEDWIGIRTLDEQGRLEMDEVPGRHMQIRLQWFADVIIPKYLAPRATPPLQPSTPQLRA